ncbi:MAG: PhoH family protein [Bacteroidales bacterium]|nr:PhoH family protein [Bacteroidales bacterium]
MKRTIILSDIDPLEIYGPANRNMEALQNYFPNLLVVCRGNSVILEGSETDINTFGDALDKLVARRMHKTSVNPYDVEDIMEGTATAVDFHADGETPIVYGNDGRPVKARNASQQAMVKAFFDSDLIFAAGPAGTGKTYMAIALAVRALKNREVKRIVLTRPAVEAGEKLGFLPGDLKDKLDPYLQPLYDALGDMIPPRKLSEFMADGTIQIVPLAYMRGRTLESSCVILDEAQNTYAGQIKMFLTRMGRDSKFIVTGDATQVDLPNKADSGLLKAMKLLEGVGGVSVIRFTNEDIVRHPLVTKIVKAFENIG